MRDWKVCLEEYLTERYKDFLQACNNYWISWLQSCLWRVGSADHQFSTLKTKNYKLKIINPRENKSKSPQGY